MKKMSENKLQLELKILRMTFSNILKTQNNTKPRI